MLSKKVKSRIFFLILLLFLASLVILIGLKTLEENVVYFFSPTEVYNNKIVNYDKKIRIGGLVKEKSVKRNGTSINFIVTDNKNEIIVTYDGLVPNLFSEGKGVVAEGKFKDKKYFVASKILAKHDENYMPSEVKKALENSND